MPELPLHLSTQLHHRYTFAQINLFIWKIIYLITLPYMVCGVMHAMELACNISFLIYEYIVQNYMNPLIKYLEIQLKPMQYNEIVTP